MAASSLLFFIVAFGIILFALGVILSSNPIYSALYLVLTMVSVSLLFFMLKAPFIAGVQLIVYAGAVMVLFVMVLMLFDLRKETEAFSKGKFTGLLKIGSAGWLCGLIAGATYMSSEMFKTSTSSPSLEPTSTKALATELFTRYVFAFETLGVLLLLIAIGVVAVSRIKGGTHAK